MGSDKRHEVRLHTLFSRCLGISGGRLGSGYGRWCYLVLIYKEDRSARTEELAFLREVGKLFRDLLLKMFSFFLFFWDLIRL